MKRLNKIYNRISFLLYGNNKNVMPKETKW